MRYFLFLKFILLIQIAFATDNYPVGTRSSGVANASVTYADVWSTYHNQACLALVKQITAGVFYENRFLINDLGLRSAAIAVPMSKAGTFGLSATIFGYSLYNEKKAGLAYAKKFGNKIAAGIQLDYLNTFFNDEFYGSRTSFAAEAGLIAEPISNLKIGAHVFNPTKAKIAEYGDEHIPVIMRFGVSYKFSEKVLVSSEVEKDIDFDNIFKTGLEYHPMDVLYIRAGIASNPTLSCFGFGLRIKQFIVDMSTQYHDVLGFSPQFSLGYEFK
jgi:hypothetical protein